LVAFALTTTLGTLLAACAGGPTTPTSPTIDLRGPVVEPDPAAAAPIAGDPLTAIPAALPFPPLPPVAREGEPRPPSPRTIDRDGWVVDRFTAEGQSVRYPFEARAGELSLFELATWGYARGWSSTAGIRLLDPRGKVLVDELRPGTVVYRPFLAFVAPETGLFVCELRAEVECFRYTLVRHSSYAPRARDQALALGDAGEVHSYLASGDDFARFTLRLDAGAEVAFKVQGTRPEAREETRSAARESPRARRMAAERTQRSASSPERAPSKGAVQERRAAERGKEPDMEPGMEPRMAPDMDAGMERSSGPALGGRQFQTFRLRVLLRGEPLAPPAHYVRFTAPEDGDYEVEVSALYPGDGGLFELLVERGGPTHAVSGTVVGPEDEVLAGAALEFLREPDLDPVASVRAGEEGDYAVRVPPGSYRIRIARPDGSAHEVLALVEEDRALDLLVP
jgi:hypothetical protein